jgi:hypothetical protein
MNNFRNLKKREREKETKKEGNKFEVYETSNIDTINKERETWGEMSYL